MNKENLAFNKLYDIISSHGYSLYLVGGTVRDLLLNISLTDMDVVTDATPLQMKEFLSADYTFMKMGCVKIKIDEVKFDITTLRKEKGYKDYRHPQNILFIKDLYIDHKRRDFTINSMYMDHNFKLIDYENGQNDLNNHIIKMVGNPYKRIKEDPLRILRAIRFSLMYKLTLDRKLEKAMIKSKFLLEELSKDKIKQELKKIKNVDKKEIEETFDKYSIKHILNVLE